MLTESKRQEEAEFYQILNKIRIGEFLESDVQDYFRANVVNNAIDDTAIESSEDTIAGSNPIKPSKLECTNAEIVKKNMKLLVSQRGELMEYPQLKVSDSLIY